MLAVLSQLDLPQSAVVVAVCALLVTVLFGVYHLRSKRSVENPPLQEVVVRITKQDGLPATGIVVRGPTGTARRGDERGIFFLPGRWVGEEVIVEDAATGKTILKVTLQRRSNGMIELVIS